MTHAMLEDNTLYPVPVIKTATDKKKLEVGLNKKGILALKEMLYTHAIEYLYWKLSARRWQKSNIQYPGVSKDDRMIKHLGVNP